MHVLVIGGTGMLRGVSLARVQAGDTVSVVARSHSRLARLQSDAKGLQGKLHPIAADYANTKALQKKLERAVAQYDAYTHACCWIHSTALHAPVAIASLLARTSPGCVYIDICGSAAANPLQPMASNKSTIGAYPALEYRKVILGFVVEGTQSRWLTHGEISAGVLQAIEKESDTVVGVVQPWSAKP